MNKQAQIVVSNRTKMLWKKRTKDKNETLSFTYKPDKLHNLFLEKIFLYILKSSWRMWAHFWFSSCYRSLIIDNAFLFQWVQIILKSWPKLSLFYSEIKFQVQWAIVGDWDSFTSVTMCWRCSKDQFTVSYYLMTDDYFAAN